MILQGPARTHAVRTGPDACPGATTPGSRLGTRSPGERASREAPAGRARRCPRRADVRQHAEAGGMSATASEAPRTRGGGPGLAPTLCPAPRSRTSPRRDADGDRPAVDTTVTPGWRLRPRPSGAATLHQVGSRPPWSDPGPRSPRIRSRGAVSISTTFTRGSPGRPGVRRGTRSLTSHSTRATGTPFRSATPSTRIRAHAGEMSGSGHEARVPRGGLGSPLSGRQEGPTGRQRRVNARGTGPTRSYGGSYATS